jgi:hypothetical protein
LLVYFSGMIRFRKGRPCARTRGGLGVLVLACLFPIWGQSASLTLNETLLAFTNYGTVLALPLADAPFPHPDRMSGFKYKDDTYPYETHYHDPRVVVLIPKGFVEGPEVDLVVYFHGWLTSLTHVSEKYRLFEQFAAARKNALLVLPQGPRDAPDSFWGKITDRGGFQRMITDLLLTLKEQGRLKTTTARDVILVVHSGGYSAVSAVLDRGGLARPVREVWLFDALYGQMEQFTAWIEQGKGRFIDFYTPYGGTKVNSEQLAIDLAKKNLPVVKKNEADLTDTDLQKGRLIFISSPLKHDEVVFQKDQFTRLLKASVLSDLKP